MIIILNCEFPLVPGLFFNKRLLSMNLYILLAHTAI